MRPSTHAIMHPSTHHLSVHTHIRRNILNYTQRQKFFQHYRYPKRIKQTKWVFYKFKPDKDFAAGLNARKTDYHPESFAGKKKLWLSVLGQFACEGKRKVLQDVQQLEKHPASLSRKFLENESDDLSGGEKEFENGEVVQKRATIGIKQVWSPDNQ